ncbi:hypothetical protein KY290_013445 [Solanum tuberosum]|uniref:Nuclear transcription factor Y subunit n=1 Tax=Solanum tuberosum TaxID=4113 RepID=A0ABQ7VLQ1_SOLTU|nr:hypothetical protein KY285_012901 [Solanum tuberosum]KAH0769464.1 hypothetical protein KY290_013445 [Solanum tuberosum]
MTKLQRSCSVLYSKIPKQSIKQTKERVFKQEAPQEHRYSFSTLSFQESYLKAEVFRFGEIVTSSIMTSSIHDLSDNCENEQPQKQSEMQSRSSSPAAELSVPGTVPPDMHYLIPSQLGNADAMVIRMEKKEKQTYPYPDPYYRSIFAPYDAQPYPAQSMVRLQLMGIQQAGVPLPSDVAEEPVFVNAKQYQGILRRRQSRAKAESENKLLKARKFISLPENKRPKARKLIGSMSDLYFPVHLPTSFTNL